MEKKKDKTTAGVGGFPPSSEHIPPLCPPAPVATALIYSFFSSPHQIRCGGQICRHRWRDHQGLPQKVLAGKHKEDAGGNRRGGGPLEVDLEARGEGDAGLRPTKSNDVVGRENRAAARISPEASKPSSASSSPADSWPRGRGLGQCCLPYRRLLLLWSGSADQSQGPRRAITPDPFHRAAWSLQQ